MCIQAIRFAKLCALSLMLLCPFARAQPEIGLTRSLIPGPDLSGWHADVPAADDNPDIEPSFAVRDGMLISKGSPPGHLITDAIYENYRLDIEYRFPESAGNCGVLVHASTPRALYGMFPASIEVQMHSGNAGDFWCIAENIAVENMADRRAGQPGQWGGGPNDSRRILNLTDDSERPVGEWNRMVIEAWRDRIRVWVNGDLVNDGFDCTAQRGRIAIQAEGTPVEFRRLDLTPINALTAPQDGRKWIIEPEQHSALPSGPVHVFILAGQSNMEGKAQLKLLDRQIHAPETAELFARFHNNGTYIERDDVWIKFLDRRGRLTVGYGSPGRIGVELAFGHTIGDYFDEPVLLIKTAWGGRSLARDFRPPSAGLPSDDVLGDLLDKANRENLKRNRPTITRDEIKQSFGRDYRAMISEIRTTLQELGSEFPELAGRTHSIDGFVWFQGWNDQYNGAEREYESNLAHFIRDVRRDLNAPDLPFVIGMMGQNGSKPARGAMLAIQQAQAAMESVPEFRGNVRTVRTDVLVDKAAEALYPDWKENVEAWERVGSDHPYHYLGSAVWFTRMGDAFAEAMMELIENARSGEKSE